MKEKERKRNYSKQNITVKEPVIGSKPTWTLCTKFVGPDAPRGDLYYDY
jgi:hypothetical protein